MKTVTVKGITLPKVNKNKSWMDGKDFKYKSIPNPMIYFK